MIAFPNWIHFKFIFLYICLPGPGLSCGLWDLGPWPRIEPGLHWECGVLALDHEKNPWIYFKGTMRAWWHYFQLVPHEAGLYSILCCYSYNRDGGGSGTMCGRSTTERSTAPNVLLLFSVFLMNSTFKAQVSPYFLQPWAQPVPSPLISLPLTQPLFIFGTCPPAHHCWLRGSDDNFYEDASFPSVGMHLGRWCHSTSCVLSLDPGSQAHPGSTVYSESELIENRV